MPRQFRMTILPVKDGNGYVAQWANLSFWAKTRIEVISDMLQAIEQLYSKSA